MKKLLYFGCIGQSGHYLWVSEHYSVSNVSALKHHTGITMVNERFLHFMDGAFVPPSGKQGVFRESIVPPFRIIAWSDYTVDSRPGSNSALLGYGYANADEILIDAINHFPSVMQRQTSPLRPEDYFAFNS